MRSTAIALNFMGNVRHAEINKIFRLEVGGYHFPKNAKRQSNGATVVRTAKP